MKIPTTPEELIGFLNRQNLEAKIVDFRLTAPNLNNMMFDIDGDDTVNISIELVCNPPIKVGG